MSNTVIKIENLGKKYIISHEQSSRNDGLRDVLSGGMKKLGGKILSPFGTGRPGTASSEEEFWALKDICFEVKEGERIGIIGRNGAGKSTLLKILSQITEPTTGRIEIDGRVASLLEVGTGFHQELSGRENIFMNGAILGMRKAEIKRKFDEIVAFAEIEKFLDTPVKRYSSGMYVRLAFAVAAHLEPEILVVDEVLAVGDAQFQKKCLGKMEDVAKQGRTVLFVSHNMQVVNSLCDTALLLQNGMIQRAGKSQEVIEYYLAGNNTSLGTWGRVNTDRNQKDVIIVEAKTVKIDGEQSSLLNYGDGFGIEITYNVNNNPGRWALLVRLLDSTGLPLFTSWDTDSVMEKQDYSGEHRYRALCSIPPRLLRPGRYSVSLGSCYLDPFGIIEYFENVFSFEVTNIGYTFNEGRVGAIAPVLAWHVEIISESSEEKKHVT